MKDASAGDAIDIEFRSSLMTNSSLASGSIAGFQLGSAADMNRLTVNTFGYDRSFFFDESRLGYDLASVTGVVPEPTGLALTSLALASLAGVRRR